MSWKRKHAGAGPKPKAPKSKRKWGTKGKKLSKSRQTEAEYGVDIHDEPQVDSPEDGGIVGDEGAPAACADEIDENNVERQNDDEEECTMGDGLTQQEWIGSPQRALSPLAVGDYDVFAEDDGSDFTILGKVPLPDGGAAGMAQMEFAGAYATDRDLASVYGASFHSAVGVDGGTVAPSFLFDKM